MQCTWRGVFPAITTKFKADESVDQGAIERHLGVQLDAGVDGIIVGGSLGENGTLSFEEKLELVRLAARFCAGKVPVLAGVAETTTAGACRFVEAAQRAGADGFMLLPGMVYKPDPRENITHYRRVAQASDRPIMIYNNPVAYAADLTPELLAELADEPKFVAVKESSDDVRWITRSQEPRRRPLPHLHRRR